MSCVRNARSGGAFNDDPLKMRVVLVTETALTSRHGTGDQLLACLADCDLEVTHIFSAGWEGWRSDRPRSLCLPEPLWLERRPRLRLLALSLGFYWWRFGGLSRRSRNKIRTNCLPCDLVWVVVGGETGAQVARRIVEELRAPMVLHLMDLYADSIDQCPALSGLARSSAGMIALTANLAGELERVSGRPCTRIGIGRELDVPRATPPGPDGWDLLLTGRAYPESLSLLAAAVRLLPERARPRAIHYPGKIDRKLPPELAAQVTRLDFAPDRESFAAVVAARHIAYLQTSTSLDYYGRYSYPSRVTDYLAAGLPSVGHSPVGSAALVELGHARPGVRIGAGGPEQVAADLLELATRPTAWREASDAARAFAEKRHDIRRVRAHLFSTLRNSAKRSPGTPQPAN
jgi:hypothetical protein